MSTLKQRQNCELIRQYFRKHYAGKINDDLIDHLRDEFQGKFDILPKYWCSKWKPELKRINALYRRQPLDAVPEEQGDGGPITIDIPGNLDGAVKEQVNKLLEANHELSRRLDEATASLAPLRRSKELLKNIAKDLIDQV